jgi:putative membrane protein
MNLKVINIISVIIPVTVILLLQIDLPGNFSFLPHIYAPINGVVVILLLSALIAIRKKKVYLHQTLIRIAIFLSIVFLVMYILYHGTTTETRYPGTGFVLYLYYFILSSHILVSIVTIPLVLKSYYYGTINNVIKHKKLAKYAFSLWLYVAATGVLVYIFISPYYQ